MKESSICMRPKLHVIWDLDGTLVDSASEIKELLYNSIVENGLSEIKTVASFRSGPPLDKELDYMYGGVLTDEQKSTVISTFRKNYDNCGFNNTPAFAGLEEILADERFMHHIVTNKPDLATNRIVEKLGWQKYFTSIITPYSFMKSSDDKRKSKAELFALCMNDFPNEQFVGIGDMDTDAKASSANNIPAIGVLWGTGTRSELESCACTHIAQSVGELNVILKKICGKMTAKS